MSLPVQSSDLKHIKKEFRIGERDGNFFEDFTVGSVFEHAVPKTVTEADSCLYGAIFGSHYPLHCATTFAKELGYKTFPIDDLLVFHIIFGKSVRDISLNAVANLGYAEGVFLIPVYPGDTLRSKSEIIGKRQISSGKAGVVYVHTSGYNQNNECVLHFKRWVLVKKRDENAEASEEIVPKFSEDFFSKINQTGETEYFSGIYPSYATGSLTSWEDYFVGQKIIHTDGVTVEESDHMTATRLFQNNAKIHFNAHIGADEKPTKRLIYGGHVISLGRSLSFNGLENAFKILSVNGGNHIAPLYAGDTVYARSEIIDKLKLSSEKSGALRIRLNVFKNFRPNQETQITENETRHPSLILDFDYTVAIPKEKFIK